MSDTKKKEKVKGPRTDGKWEERINELTKSFGPKTMTDKLNKGGMFWIELIY